MEDTKKAIIYVLAGTWHINFLSKVYNGASNLQSATLSFTEQSLFPIIPSLLEYLATTSPNLFWFITCFSYLFIGLAIMSEKHRLNGVVASIIANFSILVTAYSGGMPVLNTNLLMMALAFIIYRFENT